MKPYVNESESIQIEGLTIENRLDRISIYGEIDITKDKEGLKAAKKLKNIIDAALKVLESEDANIKLADEITVDKTVTVDNPF